MRLGATYLGGRTEFLVWAPAAKRVDVRVVSPREQVVAATPVGRGYHHAVVREVEPGARYLYRLDGAVERPDPASRWQPDGVHSASAVLERRPPPERFVAAPF